MSAKKKFVITLISLSLVFVVAVVGLVLVLSASVQTTKAVVKVRYTADKVSAQLSAKYALYDTNGGVWDKGVKDMKNGNSTVLAFGPNETDSGTLAPEETELTLDRQYRQVIFEFTFKNTSSTIGINVESLSFPKAENVKIYKLLSTEASLMGDTNTTIKERMSTLSTEGVIKVGINPSGEYRI